MKWRAASAGWNPDFFLHSVYIRANLWAMIAFLHGKLAEAAPTHVIVDCGGVGYSVFIPVC